MRSSTALAVRMRQVLSKLHPPQAPTVKESQQLLGVLQSSFRRQLDEAHPPPSVANQKPADDDLQIPLTLMHGPAHATTHHFSTVLTHPLLEHSENDRATSDLTLQAVRHFERAISESLVTPKLVASLVRQYLQGLSSGTEVHQHERLSPLLDMWLTTAPPGVKRDFFFNPQVVNATVSLLFIEGQENKVWSWLRMVYERQGIFAPLQDHKWLRVEDNLVSNLMKMAIERNQLADATQQFVEACRYRVESGRADTASFRPNKHLSYQPLVLSWMRLGSAIVHFRDHHNIPADLFDEAQKYTLDWARSPETSKAFCLLYHPNQPSAKALYNALKLSDHKERFLESQLKAGKASRKAMMTSLLDGAQLSLNQGNRRQAEYLLDFAIDRYPDFLPRREISEVEPQLLVSTQYAFG